MPPRASDTHEYLLFPDRDIQRESQTRSDHQLANEAPSRLECADAVRMARRPSAQDPRLFARNSTFLQLSQPGKRIAKLNMLRRVAATEGDFSVLIFRRILCGSPWMQSRTQLKAKASSLGLGDGSSAWLRDRRGKVHRICVSHVDPMGSKFSDAAAGAADSIKSDNDWVNKDLEDYQDLTIRPQGDKAHLFLAEEPTAAKRHERRFRPRAACSPPAPSPHRWKERSRFYPCIAKAMAEQ